MTRDEIMNMPAGPEINNLVAKAIELSEYDYRHSIPCPDGRKDCAVAHYRIEWPDFSGDIKVAMMAVEKMSAMGYFVNICRLPQTARSNAHIQKVRLDGQLDMPVQVQAETVCLAICRAALLAVSL